MREVDCGNKVPQKPYEDQVRHLVVSDRRAVFPHHARAADALPQAGRPHLERLGRQVEELSARVQRLEQNAAVRTTAPGTTSAAFRVYSGDEPQPARAGYDAAPRHEVLGEESDDAFEQDTLPCIIANGSVLVSLSELAVANSPKFETKAIEYR